jgi:hypothetical protein
VPSTLLIFCLSSSSHICSCASRPCACNPTHKAARVRALLANPTTYLIHPSTHPPRTAHHPPLPQQGHGNGGARLATPAAHGHAARIRANVGSLSPSRAAAPYIACRPQRPRQCPAPHAAHNVPRARLQVGL